MLEEYAAYPLFRTVGIDSSFYAPPTPEVLRGWAECLPPGFPAVSKVWNQITVHTHAEALGRAQSRTGQPGLPQPRGLPGGDLRAVPGAFRPEHRAVRVRVPDHRPPERHRAAGVRRPARHVLLGAAAGGPIRRRGPERGVPHARCTSPCCASTASPTSSTPGPGCLRSVTSSIFPARCPARSSSHAPCSGRAAPTTRPWTRSPPTTASRSPTRSCAGTSCAWSSTRCTPGFRPICW